MANTLNLVTAQLLAQEALTYLRGAIYKLGMVTTNISSTAANKGDTISAYVQGTGSVTDFGSASTDVTTVKVPVTLDQHKQVKETFTADELNSTARNLVRDRLAPQLDAMVDYVLAQVASTWTVANIGSEVVEALADVGYETLVSASTAQNDLGVPSNGRNIVTNSAAYGKMLLDATLISANNSTQNDGVVNSGVLRGAAGYENIYLYPALPTAETLIGVAVHKSANVVAFRAPTNPVTQTATGASYPGTITPVTDAETGMTVLVNEFIDQDTLAVTIRLIFLFGFAKGVDGMATRLSTAEN